MAEQTPPASDNQQTTIAEDAGAAVGKIFGTIAVKTGLVQAEPDRVVKRHHLPRKLKKRLKKEGRLDEFFAAEERS